jgi:hypothetical protein
MAATTPVELLAARKIAERFGVSIADLEELPSSIEMTLIGHRLRQHLAGLHHDIAEHESRSRRLKVAA